MSAPMSTHPGSPSRTRSYAAWLRRVRLWSGLALFAYVTTHLANHALGLVSFTALEVGRGWFLLLWRNPLGTVVLLCCRCCQAPVGIFFPLPVLGTVFPRPEPSGGFG
jgi:hypothetical protein